MTENDIKETDHLYSTSPVCPHCGDVDAEWWDCPGVDLNNGEEWITLCEECGEEYKAVIYVEYSFSTFKELKDDREE